MFKKKLEKMKFFFKNEPSLFFIFLLSIVFFSLVFVVSFFVLHSGEQQFVYLADSFIHGKTYFLTQPGRWIDTINFNDRYYWPLGPFPAVFLMPLVFIFNFFHLQLSQLLPSLFLGVGVFYFIYKIARKVYYTRPDSLYWAFAFCFSSVFVGVILNPWSWWFSHTITVFLLFFTILEYLGLKRYWLIGLVFGLIFLTRATAAIGIIFFIFEITFLPNIWRKKFKNILNLILPFGIGVILYLFYNYIRFGDFLDSGYANQILIDSLTYARTYGLFNIVHIPGNLFYFLFNGPVPVPRDQFSFMLKFPYLKADPVGMSIFVTSPYFIYLFFVSLFNKKIKWLLATSLFIALVVFSYYGIGYFQFGYRYSLDFLPFLFFALILGYHEKFRKISLFLKFLIITGALFNLFLFLTMFNIFIS